MDKYDLIELSIKGAAGVVGLGLTFGICVGIATCEACIANSGIYNLSNSLNEKVYDDVNKNGNVKDIDLSLVEAKEEDDGYMLNFYGSATLNDETEIDLFQAKYSIDQSNYIKFVSALDGFYSKSLEDLYVYYKTYGMYADASEVEDILEGIIEVVSSAQYVGSTLDGTLEATSEQKTILSVTNPVEQNGIVKCSVVYAEPVKTNEGKTGILTHNVDIFVDKELGKTEAKETEQNFTEIKPGEFMIFGDQDNFKFESGFESQLTC